MNITKQKVLNFVLTLEAGGRKEQSKEIFVAKNVFFLLICLHLHLVSHQEAELA